MAVYSLHKTTALPGTLAANAIYLVTSSNPDYVEMYVTNTAGTAARRVINAADIQAMIDASIAGVSGGGMQIVADITARDALTPTNGLYVLVLDASADSTVTSGAASYVYRTATTTWIKLTEYESLDVTVQWADIAGKPTSSAAAIDAAVTASHTHANLTQLGKIGEDGGGNLTYDGNPPRARLETAAW